MAFGKYSNKKYLSQTVRYYIDKLRKEERLEWEGHSRTGRLVIKK